jgi:hypothetical protein
MVILFSEAGAFLEVASCQQSDGSFQQGPEGRPMECKKRVDWKSVDQKLKKILKKMEEERQNRENSPKLSESFR